MKPARIAKGKARLSALSMPVELGTLDAIHLATSRLWKDMTHVDLVMATHDGALALGARVYGLMEARVDGGFRPGAEGDLFE